MQETSLQFLGWENLLEKEMAIHSSVLVWRIPWPEEHGETQSLVSQTVRHDWGTNTSLHWCQSQERCQRQWTKHHQCGPDPRGCSYHQAVSRHRLLLSPCWSLNSWTLSWDPWTGAFSSERTHTLQTKTSNRSLLLQAFPSITHMWMPYPPLSPTQESKWALMSLRHRPSCVQMWNRLWTLGATMNIRNNYKLE